MIRHASALMLATALLAGPVALVTATPAFAVAPTAAQAAPGTVIYGSDGKPVAKVVDVLTSGTGTTFVVADVTNMLGQNKMVNVWIGRFSYEDGKVVSRLTKAQVQHMPVFDYNTSMGGQ
jgi:hypothetical protein